VLYHQVKVGDRLVSVNGIDVSSMTALQVSKLISLKADQHRVLVFIRSGAQRDR
jgi:C-terminal processing protease CtpA/Prc